MAQKHGQKKSGMKPLGHKHDDHEYIVARQERYIKAWESGTPEEIMEFMDPQELNYSNHGMEKEGLSHSDVKYLFAKNRTYLYDLDMKTETLHGHKHFTAWEWTVTCKAAFGPNGEALKKEEATPTMMKGCTLMWWNDNDKIIRNHEYAQTKIV
ncbi:MAG: hypothetical protein Q9176_007307 [Flavoplaca citrina]